MSGVTTLAGQVMDSITDSGGATVQLGQHAQLLRLDEFQPETYAVGISLVGEVTGTTDTLTVDDVEWLLLCGMAHGDAPGPWSRYRAVGFWLDDETGFLVADMVETYTVRGMAIQRGIERDQKAIYALKAKEEIFLP